MKLPWQARRSKNRLTLRSSADLFAYVLSDQAKGQVLRWGALVRGEDDVDAFSKRIKALGLHAGEVIALLEHDQYQVLKVETPNVPNEELKAAARWQIKEMVDAHLDDLTLDVMHVGGDKPRAQRQLFVISARNTALRELVAGLGQLGHELSVIDIWETALRNLQCAQAAADNIAERATAALLMQADHCVLTVSADGELYYTRRIDGDERLVGRATGAIAPKAEQREQLGFEYNPGDDLGGESEESAVIVELQRSIDVWERSWPDLPLARLYLVAAEHGEALAALMQRELGLRTVALAPASLIGGMDGGEPKPPAELAACLPLLGAALRAETRKL